ncbi:MAG: ABC transporter permease [Armatimonadota bacterium]
MSDSLLCALRELSRRKARTVTNILGFLLAVALLVVVTAVLQAAREASASVLRGTGTHFIAFAPVCDTPCHITPLDPKREGFVANGTRTSVFNLISLKQINALKSVKDAAPYLLFQFFDTKKNQPFTVGGILTGESTATRTTCCAATNVINGRFLAGDDRGKVVIDEAFAKNWSLTSGDTLTVAGQSFEVVGVINPGVRPARADVYMPFDEAKAVINRRLLGAVLADEANVFLVETASSLVHEQAIRDVRLLLPGALTSGYNCYKPAANVLGMNERAVWLLTLVIGAFALALTMRSHYASIIERRREIGILKAIGWTNRVIVAQVLAESLLQALAGGALGILAAAAALQFIPLHVIAGSDPAPQLQLSLLSLGAGILLALLGGIIVGVLPAWKAAREWPADALRQI